MHTSYNGCVAPAHPGICPDVSPWATLHNFRAIFFNVALCTSQYISIMTLMMTEVITRVKTHSTAFLRSCQTGGHKVLYKRKKDDHQASNQCTPANEQVQHHQCQQCLSSNHHQSHVTLAHVFDSNVSIVSKKIE